MNNIDNRQEKEEKRLEEVLEKKRTIDNKTYQRKIFLTKRHDIMKIVNKIKERNEYIGQIRVFQQKRLIITITIVKILDEIHNRLSYLKEKLQRKQRTSQQLRVMHRRYLKAIKRLGPKIIHRKITSTYL